MTTPRRDATDTERLAELWSRVFASTFSEDVEALDDVITRVLEHLRTRSPEPSEGRDRLFLAMIAAVQIAEAYPKEERLQRFEQYIEAIRTSTDSPVEPIKTECPNCHAPLDVHGDGLATMSASDSPAGEPTGVMHECGGRWLAQPYVCEGCGEQRYTFRQLRASDSPEREMEPNKTRTP